MLIIGITLFPNKATLYSQPLYDCYNRNYESCNRWSEWDDETRYFTIPEILGCVISVYYTIRYCLDGGMPDYTIYQIKDMGIGMAGQIPPASSPCVVAFESHFMPGGVLDMPRIRAAFAAAFHQITEQMITEAVNDPNYDGRYDCPNILEVRRYFPGDCMKYCYYYVNQKPKISEVACVQNYCCGIVLQYCWENGAFKMVNDIKFGDGQGECYIQPEPTLDGCPEGSYQSTHCYNSCLYGE